MHFANIPTSQIFAYLWLDVAQELKNILWHAVGTCGSTGGANVTSFGLCSVSIQSTSEPFMYCQALVPAGSCVLVMPCPLLSHPFLPLWQPELDSLLGTRPCCALSEPASWRDLCCSVGLSHHWELQTQLILLLKFPLLVSKDKVEKH